MYYYEVHEIGRESVKSVNASILATIIKELVNKFERNQNSKLHHRKYYIRCKDKLEFTPKHKKNGDDEGFESDANEEDSLSGDLSNEDTHSTTSSSYFVHDHVFKTNKTEHHHSSSEREPASLVSIIGSIDSANSSGSSDTDDLDLHSFNPSPLGQTENQSTKPGHGYSFGPDKNHVKHHSREEYPLGDVIFCHTEPKHPRVIAWVIKKQQPEADYGSRLGKTGVENFSKVDNCLEVIVVKCRNDDNLRDLCANYQEYSKRIKLDQYKTIKRRRDERHASLTLRSTSSTKEVKVSLSDMKIASSSLIKASELSILSPKIITSFGNDLKTSVSLNSLNKPEHPAVKTDADVKAPDQHQFHSTVKKTQSLMNLTRPWDIKSDTLSRNANPFNTGSILKDHFNLIQRTDLNGVTHLEISKAKDNKTPPVERFSPAKSKLRREIEGVILTDVVDTFPKKEQTRQRQGSENDRLGDAPPIRPERKKYLKKKPPAPLEDIQKDQKPLNPQPLTSTCSGANSFFLNPQPTDDHPLKDQRVLKGPYVRVQSWGSQHKMEQNGNGCWQRNGGGQGKHVSRYEDRYEDRSVDRRRSKSAGRPPKKTPMAYRYVDIVNDYRGTSGTKRGVYPQKVAVTVAEPIHDNLRRRKSFDDIMALDNLKGNLKSVIKKNKINDKYCEPKKVTFSAFATVQVVD